MKAKVKSTGEIITIVAISTEDKNMQCYGNDGIMRTEPFCVDDLLIIPEYTIDWEQRRYEIAKDVMAASINQPTDGVSIVSYVHNCVQWADALIEELKKKANE
ncbi:hypothetical protein [Hoylesella timonensis]|uniref:hypothetical protein n=1 Tax=Hoylesella timonensis TaxID=386414 RepID=UPI0018983FE9|nr:hypothetical protein [Hoylesella timonensis]